MKKKGLDWILESFEDRKRVVAVGILCTLYFVIHFLPHPGFVAKILPPWPVGIFALWALAVLGYQVFVWKKLKLFQPTWFRDFRVWVLFYCELSLLLFAVIFLTWPLYLVYAYLTETR